MQCCGFYNRIRGYERLSHSLCKNVCVCVCVHWSLVFLFSFPIKKQPAHHLLLPNPTADPALKSRDIFGLMESSSWPLCLKPGAYRGISVHFRTTNTAGSNCRFKDFLLSPVPNLSMTYIKLFWDWSSKRKYLGHFRQMICWLLQKAAKEESYLLRKQKYV